MTEPEPGDDLLLARAYLSRVAEPTSVPVWSWVRLHGPLAAAETIRAGDVPADVAAATAARRERADPHADLDAAARHGIRLLTPESRDWPHFALAALEAAAVARLRAYRRGERTHRDGGEPIPPLALWVRGELELRTAGLRWVALVGARAASDYGLTVTADLAYTLADRSVVVVSGGAYGIDAAGHRGALGAEGSTVLVSAGGLDRPYPVAHARLFDEVAATGLLVSESPPGSAPQRHRFLTRNRLIAAFATGTVVVEAARRSGALNTARHARALGRPVMAVPGPVSSMMSAGCHDLLRGEPRPIAVLVASAEDILAVVGCVGEGLAEAATPAPSDGLQTALDRLDPVARRVFDGMPAHGAAQEDELAVRSGLGPVEVIRALPALCLAGLVVAADDGYRLAPSARRRAQRGGVA